ncbi:RING finger protein 112-like [Eleutherodactylus coqui]|uniref:RING finger protein 112-like n=1 Tax=Eleutherodactylus coqui TaxID=57060 RepID=UPI00346326FF
MAKDPGFTIFYDFPCAGNTRKRRRLLNPICGLCNKESCNPIQIPCGHDFCFVCFSEYRDTKQKFGYRCPSCINQEPNEPLQLVSVDENGQLVLEERVLHRCFLGRRIEEYPVYLISVIGEKRTGKSFLMNYIMKALQSQEAGKGFDLGAEDKILKGFPWKPGSDKVTSGIWIWSGPFILEQNGQKIAVFLLDTEGSMDMEGERMANIKMCMLNMLLSSHLVYNVNSSIKETDIDYLEIYSYGVGSDKLHNLKYFDFLIRNWYHPKKCGANYAESYLKKEMQKIKKKYKGCTFLKVLRHCPSECFLMPHPGSQITSDDKGRLKDMNPEFRDSLRSYLSDVLSRVQLNIRSADRNTLTCSEMFQMMKVFVSHINGLRYNISSPTEMHSMKTNLENMQAIKNEFQEFLSNWPFWKIKIGDQVSNKILELHQKCEKSYRYINEEDRNEQLEKLKIYLVTEGDKFCKSHNIKLLINGIPALGALGAAIAAPIAAPVAGALFAAEAAAPAAGPFAAGAAAVAKAGWAIVRRWI